MTEGDTLENAIVGAVVTALTASFVPFAPVAGGAVAGYLQGRDREEGLRVGIYRESRQSASGLDPEGECRKLH